MGQSYLAQGHMCYVNTFPVILHGIRTSTIEGHQANWTTISRLLLAENAPAFSRRRNTSYGDGYAQRKQSRNQKRQLSSLFQHPKMAIEQLSKE